MGKSKPGKKEKQAARRARGSGKASTAEQDVADVEAVKEIEERLQALTLEMRTSEASIRSCAIEAKRAELMVKELEPLGEDIKMYRQVGKTFLLQPKAELTRSLKATTALKSVEAQQMQQARGRLEAKVKSEANSLKEIIGPDRMRQLFMGGGEAGTRAEEAVAAVAAGESATADSPMPLWGKARPSPGEDTTSASGAVRAGAASDGGELAG
eukprot:CAMPEP_0171209900 /NCGR_PEP_ID=MMETSP0790-20130122/28832_1 /TAXON_ID=2925 /ORGANISM="Alexandrium catenella, Strain OF101" /LENGTH=211 /DNA_ID=CAMNT_0011675521 /DNA_START=155 /DNA_END=787 /DNA_ORIENTATION=-